MQGTTDTEIGQAASIDQQQQSTPTTNIMDYISTDIASLSKEGKIIVSTIVKALSIVSQEKDHAIAKLEDKVCSLENKVITLEDQLDDVEQYKRRDTIIISGPALPCEQGMENPTDLVVNAIKDKLKINMNRFDINLAHRMGPKTSNKDRPLIVKLSDTSKKTEIMDACVTVKPNLFVNESLIPKRRSIFTKIWAIRKIDRELFQQQCYTRDGKICVKLKISNQKHNITNEESLNTFLVKYPVLNQS
ncbi:hypothetical protein Pmani_003839 [Petrolisthes manimaculis]|uniref:Uncharacterized protein n=1 Tax=Petrolisthes manimaculis TaxID=1843537 RepID=A0AAE1QHT9_9EUCA|nr:hypothetical protein Pmani_003839 [Petrolisthes manimaculis]